VNGWNDHGRGSILRQGIGPLHGLNQTEVDKILNPEIIGGHVVMRVSVRRSELNSLGGNWLISTVVVFTKGNIRLFAFIEDIMTCGTTIGWTLFVVCRQGCS